jgi:Transposase DNA-binding
METQEEWARRSFAGAELGHGARTKRAVKIAASLVAAPRASIPEACGGSEAKRAYEFLSNAKVTHSALLSGPVKETLRACAEEPSLLLVQDTTAPSFGGRVRRDGLGPINDSPSAQGMLVHTCLALAEDGRVLGVLEQEVWSRSTEKKPRRETPAQRRKRSRESERWGRVAHTSHERLVEHGVGAQVIHVADREGDIFELFEELDALEDSFVLRATYDRRTTRGDDEARTYSLSEAESAPALVCKQVHVPARAGKPSRIARLAIQAARVEVLPPKNRERRGSPVWMNVVIVEELDPPSSKGALRWNLLTRESIETGEDLLRIVDIYARRWTIEDFHMGLKTGCALEERQLESFGALANFLVVASAIAVHALQLRDAARATVSRPASEVLSPIQLKLLRRASPKLPEHCTAQQALRAVAVLGGFFDTSKKARPGWRTLYGGMQRLLEREAGYLEALEELRSAVPAPQESRE